MDDNEAEPQPVEEAAAPQPQPQTNTAVAALNAWVEKHLHNSKVSQDTPRMNRVTALLQQIRQEIESIETV